MANMASPCIVCKHSIISMTPDIYYDCCEHIIPHICADLQQHDLNVNQTQFDSSPHYCLHIFPCNMIINDALMLHYFCNDGRMVGNINTVPYGLSL